MSITMRIAESEEQRREIFRHRYDVYVDEMRRFRDSADHDERLLREPVDDNSRQVGAYLRGKLIGSMRWIWGGDATFSAAYLEKYSLSEFLRFCPARDIVVGERIIVSASHRDRDVISAMLSFFMAFVNENRIQLVIGDCEPRLLNVYTGLGFRPYSMENISSAEAGYLIPLVLVAEDVAYLRDMQSPIADALVDFGDDARVPHVVLDSLGDQSTVRSARLSSDDVYWRELQTAYALGSVQGVHLFEGFSDDEIKTVVENSNLIECRTNDHVLRKRGVSENMYVVLSGSLEVRDRDQYIATLMRGDVLGEIAFLLSTPRTADVIAMNDETRLLALSESTIRTLIDSRPELAAKFLLNLSKLLCAKLAFRSG